MPTRPVAPALDRPVALVAVHPGPWGPIHLAATARGIVGLALLSPPDAFEADLARSARVTFAADTGPARNADLAAAGRHLDQAIRELGEYLDGRRHDFDVPIDLRVRSAWDQAVLSAVKGIRFGEAIGYGDVARRIGRVGAARAVGGSMGRNPVGILVPCHRVVAGDGSLGGYGGDWYGSQAERLGIKRHLLALEGIEIRAPSGARA
jgi:methylated-DNA-[protein]-cysteine S-methyltransferase